jgi:hypothetical protein
MYWVLLGQDVQQYFGGCWRPCNIYDEGCKYVDPPNIMEGSTGFAELAIHSDGECRHIATVTSTLVSKVSSRIACKISRHAINNNLCY